MNANVGKNAKGRITVEEHFYTDDHDIEHYCIRVIGVGGMVFDGVNGECYNIIGMITRVLRLVGGSDVAYDTITNHTVGDTFWEVC